MSRLVGRTLQGTLGWVPMLPAVWKAVPRYARRQKTLLCQGEGFWNHWWRSHHRYRSSSYKGDVRDSYSRCVVLFFKLVWIIVVRAFLRPALPTSFDGCRRLVSFFTSFDGCRRLSIISFFLWCQRARSKTRSRSKSNLDRDRRRLQEKQNDLYSRKK